MLVVLKITKWLASIKKHLYQCHPPYTKRAKSHKVLYLKFLSIYNTCIIYLHVIEACLKVTVSMFCFCYSKYPSDVMKNVFNSISIYSWKKFSLLTNIRSKRVTRKISPYFLRHEKWPCYSFKSLTFSIWSQIPF